jgi:hypothetical protein
MPLPWSIFSNRLTLNMAQASFHKKMAARGEGPRDRGRKLPLSRPLRQEAGRVANEPILLAGNCPHSVVLALRGLRRGLLTLVLWYTVFAEAHLKGVRYLVKAGVEG